MVGREIQIAEINDILSNSKSAFVAVTGRRRVGKTYLIDHALSKHYCFQITGIQHGNLATQLANFTARLKTFFGIKKVHPPKTWLEAFFILRQQLDKLPKQKKKVLFFDELPWMSTHKSNFVQLFAHFWNDYISKHPNFILVICGSATSWISKKIQGDKGGFHNRITHLIELAPFTLRETMLFLQSRKIKYTYQAVADIYMMLGGVPYYLEQIKRGETPTAAITRLCLSKNGALHNEFDLLYKALFDNAQIHEAIVQALAKHHTGMNRKQLVLASKVQDGGNFTRAISELITCGFVTVAYAYGKSRRDAIYRLIDEYSIFYSQFVAHSSKASKPFTKQKLAIWQGYAFENMCYKHSYSIKLSLGIHGITTSTFSYQYKGNKYNEGFQIDLIIDRNDNALNLCECKYYTKPFVVDKKYAEQLNYRKAMFDAATRGNKLLLNTLISNKPVSRNEHYLDAIDCEVALEDLFIE